MDWDGVGTFALFMASGAVGLGMVILRGYKARLAAMLERERIRADAGFDSEVRDAVLGLRDHVRRLEERADFTERLLHEGRPNDSSEGSVS